MTDLVRDNLFVDIIFFKFVVVFVNGAAAD